MFRPWESPQRATAHSTAHSTAHTTAGTGMETKTSQRSATLQDQRRYDTQIPQPVFVLPTQLQTGSATCHVAQAPVGYIQPATQHNSNLAVRTQHNSQQESAPAMTPPPCEALDQNSSLQSPSSPNDSAYHSISSCSTPSNTSCDISTDTSSHSTPPSGIDTSSQTTPSPGSRPTSGSRSVFSPEATSILDYWYQTHIRHPYATLTEMSILAQQCRISVVQVRLHSIYSTCCIHTDVKSYHSEQRTSICNRICSQTALSEHFDIIFEVLNSIVTYTYPVFEVCGKFGGNVTTVWFIFIHYYFKIVLVLLY